MMTFDPHHLPEGACIVNHELGIVVVKDDGKIKIFRLVENGH